MDPEHTEHIRTASLEEAPTELQKKRAAMQDGERNKITLADYEIYASLQNLSSIEF